MENKDLPLHCDFWVSLAEFLTLVLLIFFKALFLLMDGKEEEA